MRKKILIISASPRQNGNSDILCDKFLCGASEAGGSLPVESTFKTFRVFTGCLDVKEKGTVAVTGVWDEGGVKGKRACKEAYELGVNA